MMRMVESAVRIKRTLGLLSRFLLRLMQGHGLTGIREIKLESLNSLGDLSQSSKHLYARAAETYVATLLAANM